MERLNIQKLSTPVQIIFKVFYVQVDIMKLCECLYFIRALYISNQYMMYSLILN